MKRLIIVIGFFIVLFAILGSRAVATNRTVHPIVNGTCQADFNNDGAIDNLDFPYLQSHFGAFYTGNEDLDGSGVVDIKDFNIYLASKGMVCQTTPTPTLTPIPTCTPEPECLQQPSPCDIPEPEGGWCPITITPTKAPVFTVTPSPTSVPTQPSSSSSAISTPFCSDLKPSSVNDIWTSNPVLGDGKLTIHWGVIGNAERVHIVYTDSEPGDWRYSVLNVDDTGTFEISGLDNHTHYWFAVQAVNGCMPGELSRAVDPLP